MHRLCWGPDTDGVNRNVLAVSIWDNWTLTLERENKELRRANEILKVASAFFAQAELDRRLKS